MGNFIGNLGKKADKGDVSELPDQVKGTFDGNADIIDRAGSLKGLLQNGAGLLGNAPGVAGAIGKGISGGMGLLDKGSDLVKDVTGTSGYDWLGKGAGAAYNAVAGEKPAQFTPTGGPVPDGMKRITVDGKDRDVPIGQVGPNAAPAADAAPAESAPKTEGDNQ